MVKPVGLEGNHRAPARRLSQQALEQVEEMAVMEKTRDGNLLNLQGGSWPTSRSRSDPVKKRKFRLHQGGVWTDTMLKGTISEK